MAETIFGRIARGELKVPLIHEDGVCVAFEDIAPQAPVHLLVIPRQPFENVGQADAATLGHLFTVAAKLAAARCPNGYRLVTNCGAEGGQTVEHLHIHVLGGRALTWPPG